jgi:SRSO17 transposase
VVGEAIRGGDAVGAMALLGKGGIEARFASYIAGLCEVIGHADRAAPLRDYCTGLVMPGERKSVEPMAAITAPERVAAQHQSLLHFIGNSPWSDERVLGKVRDMVLPALERHGPIEAWIIDDTGFPKKGRHSVGVSRQYCGQLGKQDNCQVAVTLSIANHGASLPVSFRLYLPQDWAADAARRGKAGVPAAIDFQTKPEIALAQLRAALDAGIPRGIVLLDAGYGNNTRLRTDISALGLPYVAGILSNTSVWTAGTPVSQQEGSPRGGAAKRRRHDGRDRPILVKDLARGLPAEAWQNITWREGSADWLSSRFARVRVRAAHRDTTTRREPTSQSRAEEWLLIEWPADQREPTKYWLATLPEDITFECLVDLAKLRWRIERDYQDLKQEVGLGHFEGRRWRGFHHHATLCIAAYGFLISERETIPPSALSSSGFVAPSALPQNYRPRGAADPNPAPHTKLHRDNAPLPHRRSRKEPVAMPMLRRPTPKNRAKTSVVTQ